MDNHAVSIYGSNASCGMLELSNITVDSERVLYQLASRLYHHSRGNPAAFVLWSGTLDGGWGLFKFIEKLYLEKTGDNGLTTIGPAENPVTGNQILVFVWKIPHEEFKVWYTEQRLSRVKRQLGVK